MFNVLKKEEEPMLTREHAIASFDFARRRILPDRLVHPRHARYLHYAEVMIGIYSRGVGKCRHNLHTEVDRVFNDDPEYHPRRVSAFCKLLDDVSKYDTARRGARKLRSQVFALGAKFHPLVRQVKGLFETSEAEAKTEIASKLGISWPEIETDLFADVIEFHRLKIFTGYPDPRSLLSRYNVAQVQTALFDAVKLRIHVTQDYKQILRYAKLAGLMHAIRRMSDGSYSIEFDGPVSVLTETRRYGVAMARFIPGLLSCKGWSMEADIRCNPHLPLLQLLLSPENGLSGQAAEPEEFDSSVEEAFSEKWGTESRNGWRLRREGEILHMGQHCFFPDFVFTHEDGRRVFLEIVGFGRPEYLEKKCQTLSLFKDHPIILAVQSGFVNQLKETCLRIVEYKSAIKIAAILKALHDSQ